MTYPVEQLTALANANLGLAFRLADVARKSGQESLQIGTKAIDSLADQARSAAAGAPGAGVPWLTAEKGAALLSDVEKVRDHALTQTRGAIEEWQKAWTDAFASSGTGGGEAFAGLFKPWLSLATKSRVVKPAPAAKP